MRRGTKIIAAVTHPIVVWRKKTPMLAKSRIRTKGVTA
jgi:hypothetical protein